MVAKAYGNYGREMGLVPQELALIAPQTLPPESYPIYARVG